MVEKLTETDRKIYRYLLKKLSNGIQQDLISEELGISNQSVMRSLKKLEKLKLIKREPIMINNRKTYRVIVIKKKLDELIEDKERIIKSPISIDGFLDIPCMSCPYITSICYEGGYFDPRNCQWLINWIKSNIGNKN
ncbi:MAG: winged helix-turn-helix transcriptional regulator [Desulfurococcaceae archaeon]